MKPSVVLSVFTAALFLASCASTGGMTIPADTAAGYLEIADGYAGISKYDKAIPFYRKAAGNPDYANAASYGLARAYALTGKWTDAVPLLEGLLAQDGGNTLVASALGYALAQAGQTDRAVEIYREIWEKNRDDPSFGRNYAEILVASKKFQEAIDLITLLRTDFPDSDQIKPLDDLEKKARDGLATPATPAAPPADAGKGETGGAQPGSGASGAGVPAS